MNEVAALRVARDVETLRVEVCMSVQDKKNKSIVEAIRATHLNEHPALQVQLRAALITQARAATSGAIHANGNPNGANSATRGAP